MADQPELILNSEDVLDMLDSLLREPVSFWDGFYLDRDKRIPFFVNAPDENLVQYIEQDLVFPGRVLELGCGPGRNAIYLAEQGAQVDAVDLSEVALTWGRERAKVKDLIINFICKNIFDLDFEEGIYDMVYDSGCFHHIPPHRRLSYLELLYKALKPGGFFALTCFVPGGEYGGSDMTDWEVYRQRSLQGGLGYTEDKLKKIFNDYKVIEIRKMKEIGDGQPLFGVTGLQAGLFQKTSSY